MLKPERDARVIRWLATNSEDLVLSSIVLAELRFFVAKQPEGRKKAWAHDLLTGIDAGVGSRFASFENHDAHRYGELMARMRHAGTPIPAIDAMIAAQALARDYPLATRNRKDFERTGVTLIDPWAA